MPRRQQRFVVGLNGLIDRRGSKHHAPLRPLLSRQHRIRNDSPGRRNPQLTLGGQPSRFFLFANDTIAFRLTPSLNGKERRSPGANHHRKDDGRDQTGDDRISLAPSPSAFKSSNGPRKNRHALKKSLQLLSQLVRGRVTPIGIFLKTRQADRFQVFGNLRVQHCRGNRFTLQHLFKCGQRTVRLKRGPHRQHAVEHRAEGINVRPLIDLVHLSCGLLRRHVTRRSHDRTSTRQPTIVADSFGQTKVRDLRLAVAIEQHVGRLQIAVNHLSTMCISDRLDDLKSHLSGLCGRHWSATKLVLQTRAVDKSH